MSPIEIAMIGIGALFLLIFLQVPIAFAMMSVGVVGFALQAGWGPALTYLASEPSQDLSSVDFACVPLFLMMGTFASVAGFSEDIYVAASAYLGHRKGGLSYATMIGCAAFGSICGSSGATAATFGKVALPEMLKRGYSKGFSTGTIAAGGTMKSLIPPSLLMILYCVIAKTFIFDLFIAAIIPALITLALNLAAIFITVRLFPKVAPVSPRASWRERGKATKNAGPAMILMLIIFGGLYSGIFTINEAASVAAVLALLFTLARGRLSWKNLTLGLRQTATTTGMIYSILIGASIFTYFVTLAKVPDVVITAIGNLHLPPMGVIVLLLGSYLVLGTIFDEVAAIIITLPLILPVIVHEGYDPIWWGVMNVIEVELAAIHPPFGVIVFVLAGVAPDIPLGTIYKGVVPFIIADFISLILLMLFPQLALWLPSVLSH